MTFARIFVLVILSPLWLVLVVPTFILLSIVAGLQFGFTGKGFNPWKVLRAVL